MSVQAETEVASSKPAVSLARSWVWLWFVALGALVVSLSQSILIPVLPSLPAELDASPESVQWMLTSTLLVGAIAVPFLGRLGDMFGKRLMLLIAIGALTVGSLVSALSNDVVTQIIGRAIQGISLGAIPLGISLLATLLPRERAGTAVALISSMLGVGGALGLPLSGLVAQSLDFHALFWITTIAGAVSFLGIILALPEAPNRAGGRFDLLGAVLLAAALVSLLLPLSQGNVWGWASPGVIALLVAAVVLFGIFGWWQTRASSPVIDLAALRRRPILFTNLASLLFGFALFASLIGTSSYVQAPVASGYGFGSSQLVAGLTLLPSGLAMLVLSPVSARLVAKIGAHWTLALGAAFIMIGWLLRIVLTAELWQIVVAATIVGIGTGIGYAAMPSLINMFSPPNEIASANSINSLVRSLGSSLASAFGGTILAAATVTVGPAVLPSLGAYQILFAICAVAAALCIVLALLIPARRASAAL